MIGFVVNFTSKFIEKSMRKLLNKMRETAAKQDPASHESETRKAQAELEVEIKLSGS